MVWLQVMLAGLSFVFYQFRLDSYGFAGLYGYEVFDRQGEALNGSGFRPCICLSYGLAGFAGVVVFEPMQVIV